MTNDNATLHVNYWLEPGVCSWSLVWVCVAESENPLSNRTFIMMLQAHARETFAIVCGYVTIL